MRSTVIAAFAAATLAGAPAFAADFTFEVPVVIENIAGGQSFEIDCYVSVLAPGASGPAASAANVVGRASKTTNLVNGTFRGTVVVEFNAGPTHAASAGKQWKCYLSHILGRKPDGSIFHVNAAQPRQDYEAATGKKIARQAVEYGGALP